MFGTGKRHAHRRGIAKAQFFGKPVSMSKVDEAQALNLLADAIARLENAVANQTAQQPANELKVARKHAALRAEVTQALRDLDIIMEAQHG